MFSLVFTHPRKSTTVQVDTIVHSFGWSSISNGLSRVNSYQINNWDHLKTEGASAQYLGLSTLYIHLDHASKISPLPPFHESVDYAATGLGYACLVCESLGLLKPLPTNVYIFWFGRHHLYGPLNGYAYEARHGPCGPYSN